MVVRTFLLPDLGEGLEDAEIVAWRVAEGDPVELNQTLVEVNTAKALVELPSPWAGVIERLHAGDGDVVTVGSPLVSIRVEDAAPVQIPDAADEGSGEPDGPAGTGADRGPPKRRAVLVGYGVEEEEPSAATTTRLRRGDRAGRTGPVAASPPVRRLAKELGVDLAVLEGTGPGGRITREDVQRARTAAEAAAELHDMAAEERTDGADDVRRVPVRGARRLIAQRMSRSVREIPHVTTFLTVDATWLMALREELTADSGQRVSALAVVVRALATVCADHPTLNASFHEDRGEILLFHRVHAGIATDTDQGLLVPVVRDAHARGIVDLAREIARVTEAARAGSAAPDELSGSTVTVTNVGTFGAEFGTPIINHPEGAILALGVIEPRALVVDGVVEARPATTLSLSFDHRLMDGAEAGRALKALGDLLQSPFKLGALPR